MTGSASSAAPVLSEAVLREYARVLVDKAPAGGRGRVLALKGDPRAAYPTSVSVGEGVQVQITACVSSLAVRAALADRPPDGYLVVVTDRPKEDLGETLVAQFRTQRIELADTWHSVAGLFRATAVAGTLRQAGPVVADALLRYAGPRGYEAAPAGVVTLEAAMRALTARLTGLPPQSLTLQALMEWTRGSTAEWAAQPLELRGPVAAWAGAEMGPAAAAVLGIAAAGHGVDAVTVGAAADVLWPPDGPVDTAVLAARTRLERFTGRRGMDDGAARQLADAARGVLLRMAAAADTARSRLLDRAEDLLADLGWPEGAAASTVLPAGYDARLRALGDALDGADGAEVESALADLLGHEAARAERRRDTGCAQMAVRLRRWVNTPDADPPAAVADGLRRHLDDDGWVDRALADVATGSTDARVAHAYAALCAQVADRRRCHDLGFAAELARGTAREQAAAGAQLLEALVDERIVPLAATAGGVLLVVVDGMSAAVACELADDTPRLGWQEVVPFDDPRRVAALAVLPTVTRYSRTSLLAGQLMDGGQADEKREFRRRFGGPVFHKDDLRAAAGEALPRTVRDAVAGADRLVAVVLNTVDDSLAKHDPDGTTWTVSAVQHLPALLELAAAADRSVVFTADHGHVVERGSQPRPVAGSDARWRSPVTGAPGDDEVLLAGRRVLAGDGRIVAAAVAGLRYGNKAAGYHGGATPAEVCVPVVVLTRDPAPLAAAGWTEAPPLAPAWWNEATVAPAVAAPPEPAPGAARRPRTPPQAETLFPPPHLPPAVPAEPGGTSAAEEALARAVVDSGVYGGQVQRAGRAALSAEVVAGVLTVLLAGGGRAHRDTVAAAAGIPAARFPQTLAVLKRLLNVEGYDVVGMDADTVTVVLDVALLRAQFRVGSA